MRYVRMIVVMLGFLAVSGAEAQGTSSPPPGAGRVTRSGDRPKGVNSFVPPALVQAKKVFLSNGGADAGLFPHPFTGTQDRGYGYVYKALMADPRYTLVASPADADVVMFLHLTAPAGSLGGDKKLGTEDALPAFKLEVFDRPTHYVLWTLSSTVDKATLQKTHDKNFDQALDVLLKQLAMVMAGTMPADVVAPAQ